MNKLAVFLDEFLPYHPDLKMQGIEPVNPKTYYDKLNRFFDFVESKGYEVWILLHPKSDDKNYFNGRIMVKRDTNYFVEKADLVIAHASTSINFAVLHYKPIIFITTDEINKTWEGEQIKTMAGLLGKEPILI